MTSIEQVQEIEQLVQEICGSESVNITIGEFRIIQDEEVEVTLFYREGSFFRKSHRPLSYGVLSSGSNVYIFQYIESIVSVHTQYYQSSQNYKFEHIIDPTEDELFQYNVLYDNFIEIHPILVYCINNYIDINLNSKFSYKELIEKLQNYYRLR